MQRVILLLTMGCCLFLAACMGDDGNDDSATPTGAISAATATNTVGGSDATTTTTAASDDGDDATPSGGSGAATGTTGSSADATATTDGATATTPSGANSTPTTDSGTGANATPTSGSGTVTGGSAEEAALIAEIKERTAENRELEFLQDVPINVISREELAGNLLELIESEYSREEAVDDALEMWMLRLVPDRDLDLYQFQLDLLGEQVAGYYDTVENALFVVDDSGGINGSTILTLSHELTHALQDQHYDLEALQPEDLDADASTAVLALIEGDAESMTYAYIELLTADQLAEVFADAMSVDTTVLDSVPVYISDSLYFPYEYGIEFVDALLAEGGEAAVDAALTDPPLSTEQILHPEKYLAAERDNPMVVDLPDVQAALGEGWELASSDALGEFDLQVMLRENGAGSPEAAAAGWGGSSYALYQSGSGADAQAVVVMGSVWDTPTDADEFRSSLRDTLDASIDNGAWTDEDGRTHRLRDVNGVLYLISGTDSAAVDAVSASISG